MRGSVTRNYGQRANVDSGRESATYGHTRITPVEKPLNTRSLTVFFVLAFLFIGLMVVGSAVVS